MFNKKQQGTSYKLLFLNVVALYIFDLKGIAHI